LIAKSGAWKHGSIAVKAMSAWLANQQVFSETGEVLQAGLLLRLNNFKRKTITSGRSRRLGKVDKEESVFVRMCLRELCARKRGLGGEVPGG
jgi:hypothetical protein